MSWQNRLLVWALRRWIKPDSLREQDIALARARTSKLPFGAKLPRGWRIRVAAGGEWIEPAAADHPARSRCILYLHGGGYTTMSARTHRVVTSRLAVASDARVFALDYRLAPEHPFPAALDDAFTAWHALVASGAAPSCLMVAGDSAGGGLALALLVALRDAAEALPAAAILFSPWTDLAATGDSIIGNDKADPLFHGAWVARQARHYLGDTPATHPLASPLYADLTGLPPLLIQASDCEVLLDDSRRLARQAACSGVAVTLRIWSGPPHGWQLFAPILPEARAALSEAAEFARKHFAGHGPARPGHLPQRDVV